MNKELEVSLKLLSSRLSDQGLSGYIIVFPDQSFEVIFAETHGNSIGDEFVWGVFGICTPCWI